MLTNFLTKHPSGSFETGPVGLGGFHPPTSYGRPLRVDEGRRFELVHRSQSVAASLPAVNVTPNHLVARRGMKWRGMAVEFLQATSHDRIECSFRSPVHMLAVYQHGTRREGESYVEGLPRSTLRDMTKKLIFVPASHTIANGTSRARCPASRIFTSTLQNCRQSSKPTRRISRLRRGFSSKTRQSGT